MISAVEWLVEQLEKLTGLRYLEEEDCAIKAKEMEKQQIIEAYSDGVMSEFDLSIKTGEQYYNETIKK